MASRTQFPEIWQELAAPIPRDEVKVLRKGGKGMPYITARTAMNRLDAVLGPENWWDQYTAGETSVECRLTVRLPDGQTVTKVDAGAYAGMADQGDDDKSGYSDAFKRAAVKFGIARELYGDGAADIRADEPAAEAQAPPKKPQKTDERTYREFIVDAVAYGNREMQTAAASAGVELHAADLIDLANLERRLHAWTASAGLRPKDEDRGPMTAEKREAILDGLYRYHTMMLRKEIRRLVDVAMENGRAKVAKLAGKGDAHEPVAS